MQPILTTNFLKASPHLAAGDVDGSRHAFEPWPLAAAEISADGPKRKYETRPPRTATPAQIRALRVNDAVTQYGLSRSTLYKLMAAGTLRSVRVGGRRLIPRDALEALIAAD